MDVFSELSRLGSLVRQLQGALGGNRLIFGWIDTTSPTILGGAGFTVVRLGAGDVRITFTKAFSGVPVVNVGIGGSGGIYRAKLSAAEAPTASTARIAVHNDAGVAIDSAFTFLASAG